MSDIRRVRDDLLQTQLAPNPRGRFHFGVNQTASGSSLATSFTNSFASFLLDAPSDTGRDYPLIFPWYRAWQDFSLCAGQVGRDSKADDRPWPPLGVLPAGHACVEGRLLAVQPLVTTR